MISVKKRSATLSQTIARRILPLLVFSMIPMAAEAQADLLSRIAYCESRGIQFVAKGKVLRNASNHIGIFQFDKHYHVGTAQRLGFNLYDVSGQWGYARWVIRHHGTWPWLASKHCWRQVTADRYASLFKQK